MNQTTPMKEEMAYIPSRSPYQLRDRRNVVMYKDEEDENEEIKINDIIPNK